MIRSFIISRGDRYQLLSPTTAKVWVASLIQVLDPWSGVFEFKTFTFFTSTFCLPELCHRFSLVRWAFWRSFSAFLFYFFIIPVSSRGGPATADHCADPGNGQLAILSISIAGYFSLSPAASHFTFRNAKFQPIRTTIMYALHACLLYLLYSRDLTYFSAVETWSRTASFLI